MRDKYYLERCMRPNTPYLRSKPLGKEPGIWYDNVE